MESRAIVTFKAWFKEHHGQFHSSVKLLEGTYGLSAVAQDDLPADTNVVSCPFDLVISPDVARNALSKLMVDKTVKLQTWSERKLICTYISLHWFFTADSLPDALHHLPYIQTLPSPDRLRTCLHFTDDEIRTLQGTNVYGATLDREREWRAEWRECQMELETANVDWGADFTWEKYLTAATYLSSRAFPSSLLSPHPTLISSSSSYPVLLPGVDSLNHRRSEPVSWVVSYPSTSACQVTKLDESGPTISLVSRVATPAGHDVYNNYGPKPNSELILGYGFTLPQNPDDTIVLQIGGAETASGKKWEVGRGSHGAEDVWNEILRLIAEDQDHTTYEDELEAADMLAEMVQALLDHLPDLKQFKTDDNIRPEVAVMIEHYVEGQRDILESLLNFAQSKERDAIEFARQQGIQVILEDE